MERQIKVGKVRGMPVQDMEGRGIVEAGVWQVGTGRNYGLDRIVVCTEL